ncbi:MAG: SDR family oxidoreductase [Candidatus Marinimicrobia bacterium]|jgi:NAD(P)-dependent dehydrogenase (short-subunit alcohol dehydrogenase family)|nr:SDR family oxidoreductase [Candidatus Neomarinimicrobiota bacterium]MBT3944329.1 SDR family oxidoreductase [Candidatus Neomarinimicrobiota bacterium]MBT4112300.1 SDR family oxidoreductase [Candidatus Neomarinimicrobiota bacterium]MBT4317093.1 SDR family oxidoreductase [Candidatus Neomarinimicrobiota bacterium]MBT4706787.1 SDR family oxidoreductase [Candidatus Neomarinimicrobiota bacterium]
MDNKTIIVTGATDGIGLEAATKIASLGNRVGLVGRNPEKGAKAIERITSLTGNDKLDFFQADLSSVSEINKLSEEIKNKYSKLNVLLNNAGGASKNKIITSEGLEKTFATNQMNYFTLTTNLMDMLSASEGSRVVNVASNAHIGADIDFHNINGEKGYSFWKAYCISKLMNIMFTYRLAEIQNKVIVNALHPGFVDTNIGGNEGSAIKKIVKFGSKLFARTVENGADSSIYLSTSDEVNNISGKYFFKCRQIKSSKVSYDKKQWDQVWNLCQSYKEKLS